ncbi:MAG: exonuclease domain-containing protein [Dehalococcoidia bacterium]
MPAFAHREYVAIDLETTGFDPAADRIIEVGAVRFDRAGHARRFQSLVQPGRPIPPFVQTLTGITDHDVADARLQLDVIEELRAFVDGCEVVGHNVQFDLSFLQAAGLAFDRPSHDTFDLASALLPAATRLGLSSLAATLRIDMPVAHRALADADATHRVFLDLLDRLEALPRAVLLDLLSIADQSEWSARALLLETLERDGGAPPAPAAPLSSLVLAPPTPIPPPLVPRDDQRPVHRPDVDALFAAAAASPLLPGFEVREGQLAMARAVATNIEYAGHLAVEAGTGTGKSVAYLLPSLLHALRNDDRVVVSTHTLNLQEQLAQHDLPAAAALVEAHEGVAPGSLRATVLKGRANYLCLERWAELRATPQPRNQTEARLHARIAVWLPTTETGELGEIAVAATERSAWNALSADSNDCLARRCAYVRDGSCFLLRARARAAAAHVVIVNHALLLTNAATGDQVLPPFRHLVVDEAHRLEGAATQRYGASLSLRDLESAIEALGPAALRMRELAAGHGAPLSPMAGLRGVADALTAAAARVLARIPDLDATLRDFLAEFEEAPGADQPQLLITAASRAQPSWGDVELAASQLDAALLSCNDRLLQARSALNDIEEGSASFVDRLRSSMAATSETASAARWALQDALLRTDPASIVWLAGSNGHVRVNIAPLEVADRLASDLYAARTSVTVTSATLTANGSFDYSTRSLGLFEPDTLAVPSPFDYRRAVLALVVDDIPAPDEPGYAEAMQAVLAEATRAAGGRTLALFTSHSAVRAAAEALAAPLAADGISALAHQVDGSPARLLRALVEQPRTLLLGTAAFWEGVDVRGDTLSQIAVARLPFPVPSEPVYAGRAVLYDDPFSEYALPQAVLRFRQGFGRLIRGQDERGVFLLLDRRALTRAYGEAFLEALPDCEVRHVHAAEVPHAVARWLA